MRKIAIIRGKFLNMYDMQSYEPLTTKYDITAFGSHTSFHDAFGFPTVKLFSPMDIPDFPYKMSVLNRLCIDAHHLFGLESRLRGFDLVDTAETYFFFTKQVMRAKERGLVRKVIVRVYENISHNNEGIWGRKALKEYIRRHADHFIAITNVSKGALEKEGVAQNRISVIGHGIDTKKFIPAKNHWNKLGKKQGESVTILFVGRLEKEKGIYESLEALCLLMKDTTLTVPFKFIISGRGCEEKNIRDFLMHHGMESIVSIVSTKYENMPKLYQDADIVIAPSKRIATWMEQYNIALLEAQSMGLPIVTTRSGGIPENVGEAGLYAKEGDAVSLAREIKRFIVDPKLRLTYGKKARKRAETVHDIHHIVKRISAVYEKVLL